MRRTSLFWMLLCCWLICEGSTAYAQEWKAVSREKGIVGYTRASGFPLDEVRAVGVVDAPLPALEAVLRDIPAEKRFGYRCVEAYRVDIPGVKATPDAFPIYYRMQLPYPVQDRDTIWLVRFLYNPTTGTLKADLQTLDTNHAQRPGIIRMRRGNASFILKPVGQNRTEIVYTAQCDPGGTLPAFLVNMILKDFAPTTIVKMREVVKDPEYFSAAQVVTKTPLK